MRRRWPHCRPRIATHRLTSHWGNSGTIGSTAHPSLSTSLERISACLIAARMSRRSVTAGAGSTVMSIFVMALARVSPAMRSLTGIRQGDRAVCGDPSHSLGEAGRQSREQRIGGAPECVCAGVPLVGIEKDRCRRERDDFVGFGGRHRWHGQWLGGRCIRAVVTPCEPCRGGDGAADSGDVAHGLAGVLAQRLPPPA